MSSMKAENLDIATALELSVSDSEEAKFQALRALHAKKIKQLMISIEAKEKEVAKLKVLSKDSRRTQMIQALRAKIKDMEVVHDTIKEEFARKTDQSLEEVNKFVIKKTCAGPKRFRPLSREEMENKIIELERKIESMKTKNGGRGAASQAKSIASAKDALTGLAAKSAVGGSASARKAGSTQGDADAESGGNSVSKVARFIEEINGLRNALDVAKGTLELQKEEVVRLRQRNSDMAGEDEEVTFLKMSAKESAAGRAAAEHELLSVSQKLAAAEEEIALLKSGSSLELEQSAVQLDALQTHCEKLLKQNSSLLHKLADMETELDLAHEKTVGATDAHLSAASASDATKMVFKDMEKKIARYADKLKMSEGLIAELQTDNAQIAALREQLRNKNIAIKELTKHVEQLGGSLGNSPNVSPQRVAAERAAGSSQPENLRLLELKEENTRLKQALQIAVSSNASPSGNLNLSSDSADMMRMKLESSNEEVDSLRRQLVKLQAQVQSSATEGTNPTSTSPKKSPRSTRTSPRK